ncbi:MAG: PTS sugar transporter subunit IIA [Spirochaetes bacterium]|nr:PTS sugar transporter subunit IIA [Spirochaetota bacterium]
MNKVKENIHFSSFFTPKDIICNVPYKDRDDVIKEILRTLAYNRGIGNVDEVFNAVIEREEGFSTVLSDGVAMPHARLTGIKDIIVGIATSEKGIIFTEENRPVNLVVLILTPKDKPSLYLQVLSSLSKALMEDSIVASISSLKSTEEVWKFFNRKNLNLPDYICAGDIMHPNPVFLTEHQTLKDAIDLFVNKNLQDLAVIDKDGDLIGVVTAFELLKVCLPDYILWMDDLSPIINFEPFSHILQNESSTWLAEIMSHDFAIVNEDAPAIMVAQEITKKNTRQAYVVRDKKLVGVITLQQFLNKVLRE